MRPPELSASQARENPEPQERNVPVPWLMLWAICLLTAFGIAYVWNTDMSAPSTWGDQRAIKELAAGKSQPKGGSADGAAVFSARCAACHQGSGQGIPGAFPPLAGSEWVAGKESTLAALVLNGVTGPLTVKGASFNGAMPAFRGQLSDAEIAGVLTHIRSQWGNAAGPLSSELVAAARKATEARQQPFAGEAELRALP
jgi:mono/diheme cytochrome c family protein